jgi:hypothetical protein
MAKLGSTKNPLILRARTEGRAAELLARCQDLGLHAIVGVEPDKPEDISDLQRVRARKAKHSTGWFDTTSIR